MLQLVKKYLKQALLALAKPPLVFGISCMLVIINALDVMIDRINTPLADWIDDLCVLLYPELDKYGVQVLGASFHVALAYLYVVCIRFIIPNLDSFLLFAGHYLSPTFFAIANILTPALYSSLMIVLPLIAALGLLNKVICYKKIEKKSTNDTSTTAADAKMRHKPLEYGIGLVFRIINKIKTIPEFFNKTYADAQAANEWIYDHIAHVVSYVARQIKCCRRGEAEEEQANTPDGNAPDAPDESQQAVIDTAPPEQSQQSTRMWRNPERDGIENPFLKSFYLRTTEASRLQQELAATQQQNSTGVAGRVDGSAPVATSTTQQGKTNFHLGVV